MKQKIVVVTLGPGDPSLLTLQSAEALMKADHLILRTSRHGTAEWMKEKGIGFTSLDDFYDRFDDFDEMHHAMAEQLWKAAEKQPVTYGVMDPGSDGSVMALEKLMPKDSLLQVLPGLTAAGSCLAAVPAAVERARGIRILPAMECEGAEHDPEIPLMITEIDNRVLAGDIKLWLTDLYRDEMSAVFFPPSEKATRRSVLLPLEDLDRQKHYDHTTCLYVPPAGLHDRERYCVKDLYRIMDILRGENGCPWDQQQTHESLRQYLVEEAWEVAGAIDEEDPDHIADELGDVLLQVVFHAAIGRDHGTFTMTDVATDICRKMIFRHAHIFGTDQCQNAAEVSENWERLKKIEKGLTTQASVLADVSKGLPALMRAAKVQKKAKQVGFDWDNAIEALPKIHEEADEVLAELKAGNDPAEELGDLLFAVVNTARLAGVEPEFALRDATNKFIRRFTAMEELIISDKKALKGLTLQEMDVYWDMVKRQEKASLD